ncbi:MAG: hypothetical protein JSR46_09040 [Verrucomicrobia bacterium]|nr:hypothetical protein [Verrucomicrobiota bacterium]
MLFVLHFTLFVLFNTCSPLFAYKTLLVKEQYTYEVYEPEDQIPSQVIEEALQMYTEAYFHPKLHDGLPLDDLKIDRSRFATYDEFIQDMFQSDFRSYEFPTHVKRHYYQIRCSS